MLADVERRIGTGFIERLLLMIARHGEIPYCRVNNAVDVIIYAIHYIMVAMMVLSAIGEAGCRVTGSHYS